MTAFPTPPQPPQPVAESRLRRLLGFRTRLYLTWAVMFSLFAGFFLSFDLKLSIILDKLPNLLGVHTAPNGFLQGAALTLFLCACAIVASSLLGFVTALARLSKSAVAFGIASFYTSFFRGTPLLIQILLIYLGLPQLGVVPGAVVAGIIALSLNYGAYLSEIFRAGILGVPYGQREASLALGMRERDLLAHHPAPGDAHDHPADHQPVHLDAQGLVIDLGDGRLGSDVSGAVLRTLELPLYRDADHGGDHLLADVDRSGADPGAHGAVLRQGLCAA